MTKKKFTKTYGQDAPWLDPLTVDTSKLEMIGEKRHTLVSEIAQANLQAIDGALTGAVEYEMARDFYNNLPATTPARYPEVEDFITIRDREQRARLMQRLLTDLAKRMDYVELPPPPPQGGGGSGDGGAGNPPPSSGKQPPQRQQPGQGQPQPSKGNTPAPKPAPKQAPQPAQAPAPQPQAQPKPQPAQAQPAPAAQAKQQEATPKNPDPRMTEVKNELDEAPPVEQEHGGGGVQYRSDVKNAGMFYAIRYIINRLAVDTNWLETTPEGRDTWNLGRVFRSGYNPNYLRNAQDDRLVTVDKMFLSLDTSGSVLAYAEEIAAMAAGAVGLVQLFHGTEGKPQIEIRRQSPLAYPGQAFPEWDEGRDARLVRNLSLSSDDINGRAKAAGGRNYDKYSPECHQFLDAWMAQTEAQHPELRGKMHIENFEAYLAWWLHVYRPAPGTRLLFWGDTQSVGFISPWLLKQMVRNYRFVWMTPYTPETIAHYLRYYDGEESMRRSFAAGYFGYTTEFFGLEYVGLPVLHGVNSASSVRQALRRIATL